MIAPMVTGQSEGKEGWAQKFKFPTQVAHKWYEIFYVYPEGDPFLLQPQGWDSWKPNPESHLVTGWVTVQVEFPSYRVSNIKVRTLIAKE